GELTSFERPRLSPDGHTIAVAMQRADRWQIALVDTAGDALRVVGPDDDVNRFDPAWVDSVSLVVVSDRAGTANLERVDLGVAGGAVAHSLTRVTGAAFAPEPSRTRSDSSIWFLSLHSHGYDVMRLKAPAAIAESLPAILLDPRFAPVALQRPTSGKGFRA